MEDVNRMQGFTLLELMVTVAIIGILMIAIPSFISSLNDAHRRSIRTELLSTLAFARQKAIERHERVAICDSSDGLQCVDTDTNGKINWDGALVFVDMNHDRQVNDEDERLKMIVFSDQADVQWNRGDALSYQWDGTVTGGSNGSFVLDFDSDESDCRVVVSLVGRVRLECS